MEGDLIDGANEALQLLDAAAYIMRRIVTPASGIEEDISRPTH